MRSPLTGSSWRPSPGILSDLVAWQSATLLATGFHPKHRTVSPRFLSTCTWADTTATKGVKITQRSQVTNSSGQKKYHLGPVSSKPAVRKSGRERSKGLTPDMTDALELRARQLILCVTVWVSVSIQQHIFVATTKKRTTGQVVKPIHCVLE